MSIADNYIPVVEAGNGVTTVFTGDWNPVELGSLRVYLQDVLTGVQTLQVQGVDYNAALVSTGGFRVTFITAPTSAYLVVIARVTDQDQDVPYRTSKGFDGANIERSYDKLTAMVQELQDKADRALSFPLGSTLTGVLPTSIVDEGVLVWDGVTGDVKTGITLTEIEEDSAIAAAAAAEATAAAATATAAAAAAQAYADYLLDVTSGTDITAQLQAALDAGGFIRLPEGNFTLSDTLIFSVSGTHLRGTGSGRTRLLSPANYGYGIALAHGTQFCSWDGFTMKGYARTHGGDGDHRGIVINTLADGSDGSSTHYDTFSFVGSDVVVEDWTDICWNSRGDRFQWRGATLRDSYGTTEDHGYGITASGRYCIYYGSAVNDVVEATGRHALYLNEDCYGTLVPWFHAKGFMKAPFVARLDDPINAGITYGNLVAEDCHLVPDSNSAVITVRNLTGGQRNKAVSFDTLTAIRCGGSVARIEDTDGVSWGRIVAVDQAESFNNVSTTGSANVYAATVSGATLQQGNLFNLTANFTNTGAATLNLNGLGAKDIKVDGLALTAGAIVSATTYNLAYNGQWFELIGTGSAFTTHKVRIEDSTNITCGDVNIAGFNNVSYSLLNLNSVTGAVVGRITGSGTNLRSAVHVTGASSNVTASSSNIQLTVSGTLADGLLSDASSPAGALIGIDGTSTTYAADTTPSARFSDFIIINDSSSNTITDFDQPKKDGQIITVTFSTANTTIQHSASGGIFLRDGRNWTAPLRGVIVLARRGTRWVEVARNNDSAFNTFVTAADGDTTPSVASTRRLTTANTGATSITTFDSADYDGVALTVVAGDANTTIVHNSASGGITTKSGANIVLGTRGVCTFVRYGTRWLET